MFNIESAKVTPPKKQKPDTAPKAPKRDYRYIITRELGVANKILLMVYDKHEGRNVYVVQGPIAKGHVYTRYVLNNYRNHLFVDKIDKEHALFEF